MDLNWFQLGPIPINMMSGIYNLKLAALSYLIAVMTAYTVLDFAGCLRSETNPKAKLYWLIGGTFAMGAGIWAAHFIGMLAFILPTVINYEFSLTVYSLLTAMLASGFTFYLLHQKNRSRISIMFGGILIGLLIASMHYVDMQNMAVDVNLQYLPSLFLFSIVICIVAAETILWLALQSNSGSAKRQFNFKILSAFIIGAVFSATNYTVMSAAVITPLTIQHTPFEIIQDLPLTLYIAGMTGLILGLAISVSTYYQRMVEAVQNEKKFLNAMLDNLEDGIIACDANGKITLLNKTLQKNISSITPITHGKVSSELSQYFHLYPVNSNVPILDEHLPLWKALRGERIRGLELVMKFNQDPVPHNVIIDGEPIINIDGEKLGAVIVIHDITELKKTEKMKSEFVSVVSHELRTPLTSIRGSLGLILGGRVGTFSEKAEKLLDIANKNSERLLLLISDILDMEKIQAGKMDFDLKIIDINQLINEAIDTNKMYGEKFGVAITLIKTIEGIKVNVDPNRLLQVLANLISNAFKFSPKGGVVTISINKLNDEYVRVSVMDNGQGIPLEFQPRIFSKFAQADSSSTRGKTGTGLGLCISKAMIEKLGGTLNFTSVPQVETSFYFDLPIMTGTITPETVDIPKLSMIKNKLLICEDDEFQARYINLLLEKAGLQADITHTVSEAKKMLAENTYSAILLDLILPDQDGISFIRELRKANATRDLPIIVLSVMAKTGQIMINGDAISVVDWLDKPVNFPRLLQAISRIKINSKTKFPRILQVEDDMDTQHVIASLLENEAELVSVSTIKEAKQAITENNFDLVILDLLLPDGNGIDLLPTFSQHHLPVIVYSAIELDRQYAGDVVQSLIKSQITNDEFIKKIKHVFESKETNHVG